MKKNYREKLQKRSDAIDHWEAFSATQQAEIQKLRAKLKSRPPYAARSLSVRDESGDATSMDEDGPFLKRPSPLSSVEHDPPSSPPMSTTTRGLAAHLSPMRPVSEPPPRLPTDDTFGSTVRETPPEDLDLPPYPDQVIEPQPMIVKVEPTSDEPIIMETRSVPKRKYRDDGPGSKRVQRIKSDHSSSSAPEMTHESHSPAESIDYDQEVHIRTPRKRRASRQDVHEDHDATVKETGRPRILFAPHVTSEKSSTSTPDKSRVPLHGAMNSKSHKASVLFGTGPDISRSVPATKTDISGKVNVRASPFASERMGLAAKGRNRLPAAVEKVRIDALLQSSFKKGLSSANKDNQDGISSKRTPRPKSVQEHGGNRFSAPPKFNSSSHTEIRETATPTMQQEEGAAQSSKQSIPRQKAPKKPSILRDDMPRGRSANREETPLRERSMSRLRPEDFKPNPKYNDNIPYVYDEVVRGRDARAALAGCVDPNCCGKTFRRFAEAELKLLGHSLISRREEVILMENYLGEQSFKLGTMEPAEMEDTWLKAKTWDLANKFGKHRQRYSRMPTPPGFWKMDFPDTQERAEERRQADGIRKALVSDRYREAMRCNGSWLFRDEEEPR